MAATKAYKTFFTNQLMDWHLHHNQRSLPWKSENDPYKIWLSEIILQQTRAEQGLPYYLKFLKNYPTVLKLANADDEAVFKLWQGLGYYNRCKNLLATARFIRDELGGKFPQTYDALLQLKGVGNYTAAAIASFAYHLPHAVVDGNVYRVLSRYFGIETPCDTTEGKKEFQTLANEVLDKNNSANYNQAIMDIGAIVCKPSNPLCEECPLQKKCVAYKQNIIQFLPVKSKKLIVRKRYFNYILLLVKDEIWIHKRTEKDIWQNLFEPLLIETENEMDLKRLRENEIFKSLKIRTPIIEDGFSSQKLTHQIIETKFFTTQLDQKIEIKNIEGIWVRTNDLNKYPFPKTLVSFLEKKLYF